MLTAPSGRKENSQLNMQDMNPAQQRAVSFGDGAMLLLAGPGSGKTFVIVHRIKRLIESGRDPNDILVITFTKAAALQMQDRFWSLMYPQTPPVHFGTFHAIFYSILKHHPAYRKAVPITDKEKLNMIKRALEISECFETYGEFDDIVMTLGLISACKNNGNDPLNFRQEMMLPELFAQIFDAYNRLLRDFDRIDFDDMVNDCLNLMINDKAFRESWQRKFKYILIDEFQDISGNQYELVKLLAAPEGNVFAVGDDDQSIYAFRGADVSLMKRFVSDFSGCATEYLSVNYRCSGNIVGFAGRVIKDNSDRFAKNITAHRDDGNKVKVLKAADQSDQNRIILEQIKQSNAKGAGYEDCAILLRTNKQAAVYSALLRTESIPCAFDDESDFFDSVYVKDICAYISIASGNASRENFLRVINRPVRYIKRDALSSEKISKAALTGYYRNDAYMIQRIDELYRHLDRIRTMSPHLAVRYICKTVGYDRYVRDNSTAESYERYLNEMDSFTALIKRCGTLKDLEMMLDDMRAQKLENKKNKTEKSGVRIMTYHSSKGLEFDTVILPDVNENKVPSRSARSKFEIEEERRMFYVAMTRAKNNLIITYRTDNSLKKSRFLPDKE